MLSLLWNTLIFDPMLNGLLLLYQLLFNNFILAILLFTVLIRLITYPLTAQQQKSTKKLAELQQSDAWKKMQEKYGKDREKMAQEQMKLYKEAGVNPFGSCLPMLIQFPVLIGLYQAINLAMAASPVQLLELSRHIYPFMYTLHDALPFLSSLTSAIPLQNHFLWLNLGLPDPIYILPLLVVVTTFVQSKIMTPPTATADQTSAQMSQQMALTMPLMIGFMSLSFPSGLSIYWVISNIVSVVQYAMTSPINWKNVLSFRAPQPPVPPERARARRKA
jgi:YidC/Oxa1 family membrane protein insertase